MSTTPPEAPAPQDAGGPGPSAGPAGPGDTGDPGDTGPRVTREEVRDLGAIRRTVGPDRKVAGVAGGLARHLDVDPIIVRVALVVLVFFGGAGVLLYGAGWLLLPEDGRVRAPLGLDDRSRSIALVLVGAVAALLVLGDTVGGFHFPWPLVVVAVIALLVLVFLDRDKGPKPTAPPVPHTLDPQTGRLVPTAPTTAPMTAPMTAPAAAPAGAPTYPTSYWADRPPTPPPASYRNPRKRGPVLFWLTLFAAAVLVAVLGVLDAAGVPVAPAAYPAVVAGTCGAALLLSAFWGRGGGLTLVGLVAALAMGATATVGNVDGSDIERQPTTAAAVPDHLRADAGEIQLDLSRVSDLAALDGRTLTQRLRAGHIQVLVPPGLTVVVHADVTGAGHIQLFDDDHGGFGISDETTERAETTPDGATAPTVTIEARLFVGSIEIRRPDNLEVP